MKLRDYLAMAADTVPLFAGCVGVIGGGYVMLCTAPVWMDTVLSLASDAACAAVCGIGAGVVLAVCVAVGGSIGRRRGIRNRDARCLGYVSAEDVCRAARRVR